MNNMEQTLREKWYDHYVYTPNEKLLGREAIADWWVVQRHTELSALMEEIEKLYGLDEKGIDGNPIEWNVGHNCAIGYVLSLLSAKLKQ